MTERLTMGSINFGAPYGTSSNTQERASTAEEMYAAFAALAALPKPEWILISPAGAVYKHTNLQTLVMPHLAALTTRELLNYDPTQTT